MYQFQMEYTYEDFLALNYVHEKIKSRKQKILHVAFVVIFASAIISLVFCVVGTPKDLFWILPITILMGIISSLYKTPERNARIAQRQAGVDTGEQSITLDEKGTECCSKIGKTQYLWSAYMGGYYYQGCYLLYLSNKRQATVLPERALVEGDPAALRAFLEEKLQKEIIDVR